MVNPVLVAAPLTILPAMGALWWLLRPYQEFVQDQRVFFALVLGFFMGIVATAFELFAFPFAHPVFVESWGTTVALLFFVAGYAFFETGAKTAALGIRQYRGKKDTPYYGGAMGLGFGAMMSLQFVARGLGIAGEGNGPLAYSVTVVILALVPIAAIFVHGAVAIHVGKGSSDGVLWRGWGIGTLMQAPVPLAYWLQYGPGPEPLVWQALILGIAALAYGWFVLRRARDKVLEPIVPPDIADRLRKEKRRAARQDPKTR